MYLFQYSARLTHCKEDGAAAQMAVLFFLPTVYNLGQIRMCLNVVVMRFLPSASSVANDAQNNIKTWGYLSEEQPLDLDSS